MFGNSPRPEKRDLIKSGVKDYNARQWGYCGACLKEAFSVPSKKQRVLAFRYDVNIYGLSYNFHTFYQVG